MYLLELDLMSSDWIPLQVKDIKACARRALVDCPYVRRHLC